MPATKLKKTLAAALAALVFLAATTGDEKRLSIYSSVATYTLPVSEHGGREYVGLLETLEPLGRVSGSLEGQHWKLRYNNVDSEFVAGRTRAKIRGRDVDLVAPFVIENGRGLVSLNSLNALLPRFLGSAVNLHEAARRLFVGDFSTQVTAQLDSSTPQRLVLNFTASVNPTISTEPGKLRMVFAREPLVLPATPTLSYDSKAITQAVFSERNGAAELTITASAPLMANFSNSGRTITVSSISPGAAGSGPPAPSSTPSTTSEAPVPQGTPVAGSAPTATNPSIPAGTFQRTIIVVDPAHGGSERGAALTDTLAEKNVTLGFARLLRHELEQRGFSVLMLRESDDTLSLDQRAGTANSTHAALYIGLHAASEGNGAMVYTALLPSESQSKGTFHSWNGAQSPALAVSQNVATGVVSEMEKHQLPARGVPASLRPLNNLVMPAIAVELAPGPNGVADLPSANYQQKAAAAVADAVSSLRDRLGVQP